MARILIVDDSQIYRDILKRLLEGGGHSVVGEAVNGRDGVEKYKELLPDLTTLDITMPLLDGIDALREIMEFDPCAQVVMVSSSAQSSKVVEATMLGAADFLSKPFESMKILECVSNVMMYD